MRCITISLSYRPYVSARETRLATLQEEPEKVGKEQHQQHVERNRKRSWTNRSEYMSSYITIRLGKLNDRQ
jgi:hypothetical protein